MSDDRKVRLGITADSTEAEGAFKRVGDAAKKVGQDVSAAGEKAGKGMDAVGAGADRAAKTVDRDTKSIVSSIERATAAINAGSKGSAAYFEQLAKQRGVNVDTLKPYLDGLRQAEAAQQAATKGLGTMGMSAKQTAAALRGVPAQFTDIFTSLASGQQPLTVFLQQGGQLKDMFGGAGNAARALGGYVVGLINPFTLAAGAVAALTAGYFAGAEEAQRFNRTLVLTGNQAGVTVGQLSAMAQTLDAIGGTTQGKATDALNALAETGKVGAENLQRFALAAINLEKVGGPAIDQTAKAFADLARDPLQGSLKLNEATNFLTKSVYEQIKALTDQGRTVEAARVAQEAYASAIEDRTPKIIEQLGYIERAWKGIVGTAAEAVDAIKGIGRPSTLESEAQRLRTLISNKQVGLDRYRDSRAGRIVEAEIEAAQKQLELLNRELVRRAEIASLQAYQAQQTQAKVEFDKAGEQYLNKQQRLERDIAQARELGRRAGESDAAIQKRIADIKEKAASSDNKAASRDREQQLKREADLLAQINGFNADFDEKWRELNKLRQDGKITAEQLEQAQTKLLNQQPVIAKNNKEIADSHMAVGRAVVEDMAQRQKYLETLQKGAQEAAAQVQRLQDEEKAAAIAAAGNLSLAQAIELVAIARLEEKKAAAGNDTEAIAAIDNEIAKRRELINLIGSADARKASERAAEDAVKAAQRGIEDIERSLVDNLMRGGKSVADYLEDLFRTLVLRPVIQPIAGFIANGATSLLGGLLGGLGIPGLANAASGAAGSGASGASGLSSLLGLGGLAGLAGQAGGIGQAIAAGFMNTIGGGTLAGGQAAGLLAGGAGTGTGFAGMLGAALPWVGGAALIGNALGLFRSTKTVGSGITGDLGGTVQDFEVRRKGGSLFSGPSYSTPTIGVSNLNSDLQATFAALRNTAAGFASTLGLDAEAARRFTTPIGSEKLSDDTGGIGIRLEGLSADEVAKKIEAELTAANERLAKAVLGSAADAFTRTGETASQTLERLAGSLQGVNGVLDALGQAALQASAQGGAYASALLDQFGSLQQFQSAAGQYLQDYYSQAERTALATQGLTQQLSAVGLSLPTTRDAYRQLVEAQDLSTEAGRKAYAALLQLAPTFAELVPAIEAVADAADETARRMAEAGRRALEDLARDSGSLRVDLLRAQGDEPAARALEREQALAAVRGNVTEADLAAITAAYDLNEALRDQIDAARAATEAQRAIEAAQKSAAESLKRTLDDLSGARLDLEGQLLTAQGREAEAQALARQRELDKLTAGLGSEDAARVVAAYELNEALRKQIAETNAANQAAQALADAQSRAAEDAARAANQFRDAWKGITDTLFDEVARIRGLFGASGGDSLASLQSRFAITTAQARAGDQEAAKLLPGLSQTLLQLAEEGAASLIDLQRIRAQVAGSLEQTGLGLAGRYGFSVPKLEVGTNYVPKDMLAMLHEGEAVVPRAFNPAASGGDNGQVVAELRALREENKAQALAIVRLQTELTKVVKRWDGEGLPQERATA